MQYQPTQSFTMRKKQIWFLVFAVLIVLNACGKRETDTLNDTSYQYGYLPLSIGQSIEYQLDSILFDTDTLGVRLLDSLTSMVREEVIDTNRSVSGDLEYKIVRSELQPNGSWRPVRTIITGRDAQKAWRTEDNFRLLKMIYPMDRRSEWDGLTWINRDIEVEIRNNRIRPFSNWAFEVDSINIPRNIGAFSFDSTLVITEANDVNAIEKRFSRVVYALHVGPVYIEQWILDSQYCNQVPPPSDCETLPWELKGERGFIVRQTVTKY